MLAVGILAVAILAVATVAVAHGSRRRIRIVDLDAYKIFNIQESLILTIVLFEPYSN